MVAEEPGRWAERLAPLLPLQGEARTILHWGAAALGASVALARLGLHLDAYDTNPLWGPLGRERLHWTGMESRVTLLDSLGTQPEYDLLVLVGERAVRSVLPPPAEIASAIGQLKQGGRVLLVGWPRRLVEESCLREIPFDSLASPSSARHRLLRPRGAAPIPRLHRRVAGICLSPLASLAPELVFMFLGEIYALSRPLDSKHR